MEVAKNLTSFECNDQLLHDIHEDHLLMLLKPNLWRFINLTQ